MTFSSRFRIIRQGMVVHTTPDLRGVIVYLWGRDLQETYSVDDEGRQVHVDDPNLRRWVATHWPEEAP